MSKTNKSLSVNPVQVACDVIDIKTRIKRNHTLNETAKNQCECYYGKASDNIWGDEDFHLCDHCAKHYGINRD